MLIRLLLSGPFDLEKPIINYIKFSLRLAVIDIIFSISIINKYKMTENSKDTLKMNNMSLHNTYSK